MDDVLPFVRMSARAMRLRGIAASPSYTTKQIRAGSHRFEVIGIDA